jgi:hypothetical protein
VVFPLRSLLTTALVAVVAIACGRPLLAWWLADHSGGGYGQRQSLTPEATGSAGSA